MKWKLLQLNQARWEWTALSEISVIMRPEKQHDNPLTLMHATSRLIEESTIETIKDIVIGYDSITLFFDGSKTSETVLIHELERLSVEGRSKAAIPAKHTIPVCYEKGPDLELLSKHVRLPPDEIIALHTEAEYKVAMMGFLPGFIYLSGLPESLYCPRRTSPRTKVEAGSVAIGGDQTGIYSFASPGGWQIIGQTPMQFFDPQQNPPTQIKAGDTVSFERISLASFNNFL